MDEVLDIDVKALMQNILKRIWIVILCAILTAAVSLMYTVNFVTPTYKASVSMYINNNSGASDRVSSSDLAVALQLALTYVNIVKSDTVLEEVVETTGLNLTVEEIKSMMSAEVVDETEMFRVSIVSPDPQMSADIANAIASVAPAEISKIIEGSNAKVIDYAKVPTSRFAPSYTTNTVVGGLVGGFVAIAVIVISVLADSCVRGEDDLMRIYKVPVLGAIPDFAASAKYTERYGGYGEYSERRKA